MADFPKSNAATGTGSGADVGTGWAFYTDTQYTEVSPQVVNQGVTTQLLNNSGSVIKSHIPAGVTDFYNGNRLTPQNVGDFYDLRVGFKAKTSVNNGGFALYFDISAAGDGSNIIVGRSEGMIRGANQEHTYSYSTLVFSSNTFVANGAILLFESIDGNTRIYETTYLISRTHNAG